MQIHETLYSAPLAFLLISPFLNFKFVHETAIAICLFLIIKWFSNYRKCTVSYLECKMRGVKKENGYLYNYLEYVINLNTHPYSYVFYIAATLIIILNICAKRGLLSS
jgi:hypothetical protein